MSMVITDEKKYQKAVRAKAFSEVLEIIDEESTRNGLNLKQTAEIRRRVEALKEGKQK